MRQHPFSLPHWVRHEGQFSDIAIEIECDLIDQRLLCASINSRGTSTWPGEGFAAIDGIPRATPQKRDLPRKRASRRHQSSCLSSTETLLNAVREPRIHHELHGEDLSKRGAEFESAIKARFNSDPLTAGELIELACAGYLAEPGDPPEHVNTPEKLRHFFMQAWGGGPGSNGRYTVQFWATKARA